MPPPPPHPVPPISSYYVAEAVASCILKALAALGGGVGGGGGGGGPLARGADAASAAAAAIAAAPGGNVGLLCGAVSSARGLGALGLDPSRRGRLSVRVSLLQSDPASSSSGATGDDPFIVSPPARINPLTARRTPLFRTSAVAPQWAAGTASWPAAPGALPEIFMCTLGGSSSDGVDGARGGGGRFAASGTAAPPADAGAAPLRVSASLDWENLKGYLLFQLFSTPPAPATGASSPPPTLVAQAVLRLCDLFAAASLPFTAGYSGLHSVVFGGGGGRGAPINGVPQRRRFWISRRRRLAQRRCVL